MEVIKKFTAIKINAHITDRNVVIDLSYGHVGGRCYNEYPKEEFDTEEEAIEYAYDKSQYATWMIVPIIKFN